MWKNANYAQCSSDTYFMIRFRNRNFPTSSTFRIIDGLFNCLYNFNNWHYTLSEMDGFIPRGAWICARTAVSIRIIFDTLQSLVLGSSYSICNELSCLFSHQNAFGRPNIWQYDDCLLHKWQCFEHQCRVWHGYFQVPENMFDFIQTFDDEWSC